MSTSRTGCPALIYSPFLRNIVIVLSVSQSTAKTGDGTKEVPAQLPCSHVIGRKCLLQFHSDEWLFDPGNFGILGP